MWLYPTYYPLPKLKSMSLPQTVYPTQTARRQTGGRRQIKPNKRIKIKGKSRVKIEATFTRGYNGGFSSSAAVDGL